MFERSIFIWQLLFSKSRTARVLGIQLTELAGRVYGVVLARFARDVFSKSV